MSNDAQVPDGWKEVLLGSVASISFSNVDKKSNPDTEVPVRLCNYMDVYRNSYITNQLDFMNATASEREINKFTLKRGDVLITKDSETPDDIAVSALVADDLDNVLCGYHLAMMRPKEDVVGGYLSHLFGIDSVQHCYYQLANGSTRFGLTSDAITKSVIPVPPLSEQEKIASILTSVDDVIEKTELQISKLQDLKKGMMQELVTNGIGHTEFKDSPVGRIPKSWEVLKVSSFMRQRKEKGQCGLPIYSVLIEGGMVNRNTLDRRVTSELKSEQNSLVCKGDLAYNMMRMWQGASGVAPVNCMVSPAYVVCSPKDNIFPDFVGYLMKSPQNIQKLHRYSQGITEDRLRLYYDSFSQIKFAIPSIEEQIKIANTLQSVDANLSAKNKLLSKIRYTKYALMQDLLTGTVRVKVN